METNLLKSLSSYITPDLISQASKLLDESEGGVTSTMSGSIPTILSGLLHHANDPKIMDSVMDLVNNGNFDASNVLSSLPSLLTDSGNTHTLGAGSSLLNILFGKKQSGLTDLFGSLFGVKKSSASKLLLMAAPMILSHLRKSGISASSLIKALFKEKNDILKSAPTGLSALMGHGSELKEEVIEKIKEVKSPPPPKPKQKWILPLLIALAAILLFYLMKQCNGEPNTPMVTETPMVEENETVIEMAEPDVVNTDIEITLPNGTIINASDTGLEYQLTNWLLNKDNLMDKDTWFNFDRLLFATSEATLLPESHAQLKNIVEILKAYPNISVKIGGYTDNTGDPTANLELSGNRAKNVMLEMIALGIDPSRLTAEGYGEQHPVASNDTDEGRAQNRRIAMRVTSK